MSDSLESMRRLRALAARLVERGDPDGAWLMAALEEYRTAARTGGSLDRALGLTPSDNGRGWWTQDALQERERLLRTIRAEHFAGSSPRAAAHEIAPAIARYQSSAWRQHRQYATPPPAILGTAKAGYFRVLKLGLGAPAVRTAQRALVCHEGGGPVAHETREDRAQPKEESNGDCDRHETETDTAA